jgi:energy-coupling factor transporter ATP-binding protein EcfA2
MRDSFMVKREPVRHLDKFERLKAVRSVHIKYPEFNEAIARIEACRKDSPYLSEPECLLLTGLTGMGKTTVCSTIRRRYASTSSDSQTKQQVLYDTVPKSAAQNNVTGAKALAKDLLHKLGEEVAFLRGRNRTLDDWSYLLYRQLSNCGVELIILDEFQHLVHGSNITYFTADWIKELTNETRIPVVLCGLPECRTLVDLNSQLSRRFREVSLDPWDYAVDKDRTKLKRFLFELDRLAPLQDWSGFDSTENVYRFYQATSGLIGHIMGLYRIAVERAIEREDTAVRNEDLARAFRHLIHPRRTDHPNPFDCATQNTRLVQPGSLANPAPSTPKRTLDLSKGSHR